MFYSFIVMISNAQDFPKIRGQLLRDGGSPGVFNGIIKQRIPIPYNFQYVVDTSDGMHSRNESRDYLIWNFRNSPSIHIDYVSLYIYPWSHINLIDFHVSIGEGDVSGRVSGSYTIRLADGRERDVVYVADEKGYRAEVTTNEKGTQSESPADVVLKSTATVHQFRRSASRVGRHFFLWSNSQPFCRSWLKKYFESQSIFLYQSEILINFLKYENRRIIHSRSVWSLDSGFLPALPLLWQFQNKHLK